MGRGCVGRSFACLFADPYGYLIVICNELCLSGWPDGGHCIRLVWQKKKKTKTKKQQKQQPNFKVRYYTQLIYLIFSYMPHVFHWSLPFYTTFTDLDLVWGSQGQRKAKSLGFIFSHFSADHNEIWHGVEAIQVEDPGTIFAWDSMKKGLRYKNKNKNKGKPTTTTKTSKNQQQPIALACIRTFMNGLGANLVWW